MWCSLRNVVYLWWCGVLVVWFKGETVVSTEGRKHEKVVATLLAYLILRIQMCYCCQKLEIC